MSNEEQVLDLVWDLRNLADWLEKHSSEVPEDCLIHAGGQPLLFFPKNRDTQDVVIELLMKDSDQHHFVERINPHWATRNFGKLKVASMLVEA